MLIRFPKNGVMKPSIKAAIMNNSTEIRNNTTACFIFFLLFSYASLKEKPDILSFIILKINKNNNTPLVHSQNIAGISIIP